MATSRSRGESALTTRPAIFTRPAVAHMFTNYDGVLKVDGEVGNKKAYDPRAWGKAAEAGMAARIVEACEDLRSAGTSAS